MSPAPKVMSTGTLEVLALADVENLHPTYALPETLEQRTFAVHLSDEATGASGLLRVGTQSGRLLAGGWIRHGDHDHRPDAECRIGAGRDAAWAAITAYRGDRERRAACAVDGTTGPDCGCAPATTQALVWESAGSGGRHRRTAKSLTYPADAYWLIGPNDRDWWDLELFAAHPDGPRWFGELLTEDAAKEAAQAHEDERLAEDEAAMTMHGRCDTCGAACDRDGCTTDRTHVVALTGTETDR